MYRWMLVHVQVDDNTYTGGQQYMYRWTTWGSCTGGPLGEHVQVDHLGIMYRWTTWGSCTGGPLGDHVQVDHLGNMYRWTTWGTCTGGPLGDHVQMDHLGNMYRWQQYMYRWITVVSINYINTIEQHVLV